MDIDQLVTVLRGTDDCRVYPPVGMPPVEAPHVLPDDLRRFYQLCGGAELFGSSAYSLTLVPPDRVVLANPVIIIGVPEETLEASKDDPSWSWYIIGEGRNAQYLTIDLHPDRLGLCYDSFWEVHPSDSDVSAYSFTELLHRLLDNRGQHWWWARP